MRTYETKTYESRNLTSVRCDLCDTAVSADAWPQDDFSSIRMRRENGRSTAEVTIVDICHKCFCGKILPIVASSGGTPTVEQQEW